MDEILPTMSLMSQLTTDLMLRAYASGIFPMAESADSPELYWFDPEVRGILPLDALYVPRRLARTVRNASYVVRVDNDFRAVVMACAEPTDDRPQTWINQRIVDVYEQLFFDGFGHSVEVWEGQTLVGGLYGISLGAAFFGESMFSRRRDTSKLALVHLAARLWAGGFKLLDTQFVTDHLRQFGAIEISRSVYRRRLAEALTTAADFRAGDRPAADLVQDYLAMLRHREEPER